MFKEIMQWLLGRWPRAFPVWACLGILCMIGNAAVHAAASPDGNEERWINADWKFDRVDGTEALSPEAVSFDDTQWQTVNLPHVPRLEKYDETHPWQGICWYRKTLAPDPAWGGSG